MAINRRGADEHHRFRLGTHDAKFDSCLEVEYGVFESEAYSGGLGLLDISFFVCLLVQHRSSVGRHRNYYFSRQHAKYFQLKREFGITKMYYCLRSSAETVPNLNSAIASPIDEVQGAVQTSRVPPHVRKMEQRSRRMCKLATRLQGEAGKILKSEGLQVGYRKILLVIA